MTDDDWQKVIAVNLSGAFYMAQAAVEHMIERGTGRIINVSSAIGETGSIGQVNYAASKSGMRWGQRMSDDAVTGALTDPFSGCHMGVTAENVAADYGVSREEQDALAAESHRRAAAAAAAGYFASQITPVQVPGRKGPVTVDADEHIRPGVTTADLARLKPACEPEGTVTAGNASGVNDAAAAVILAGQDYAERHAGAALGRLVAYAHAGVEPRVMGMGSVPAVRAVLERAHLKLDDIDLFEVNEAFAALARAPPPARRDRMLVPPHRTGEQGWPRGRP